MSTAETLRALLDGPYPETRERVRWWLSQPGNEPVDDLPLEEHRARVLEWVQELASEGDTAIGYPVEYGGKGSPGRGRDRVRDARDGRPVAAGQVRRAVRPLRRRDPAPRHRAPPRALPARRGLDGAARLLRDDGDRPRLQRAGAAHHRDLRPGDAGVRRQHARRRRAQGLHRQRRARRAPGGRLRAAHHRRRGARRARAARADPRRARRAVRRRADRGLRREARPQRRRQRPPVVRPRAGPAREPARQARAGRTRTAPTSARSRTRRGASSRCSGR